MKIKCILKTDNQVDLVGIDYPADPTATPPVLETNKMYLKVLGIDDSNGNEIGTFPPPENGGVIHSRNLVCKGQVEVTLETEDGLDDSYGNIYWGFTEPA